MERTPWRHNERGRRLAASASGGRPIRVCITVATMRMHPGLPEAVWFESRRGLCLNGFESSQGGRSLRGNHITTDRVAAHRARWTCGASVLAIRRRPRPRAAGPLVEAQVRARPASAATPNVALRVSSGSRRSSPPSSSISLSLVVRVEPLSSGSVRGCCAWQRSCFQAASASGPALVLPPRA
jgi:hypothetical protein